MLQLINGYAYMTAHILFMATLPKKLFLRISV